MESNHLDDNFVVKLKVLEKGTKCSIEWVFCVFVAHLEHFIGHVNKDTRRRRPFSSDDFVDWTMSSHPMIRSQ